MGAGRGVFEELKHTGEEKSSKLLWLKGTTNEWPLFAIYQYFNVDKYKLRWNDL